MTGEDSAEGRVDRRKVLLGGAFLGSAALANARLPHTGIDYLGAHKLDDILPKKIGEWEFVTVSGLVTAPEDQLERLLYSQLITRVYAAPGKPPIMLLVAQSGSQTGLLQVHRPEFCYTAGGFKLSPVIDHPVNLGPAILPTNLLTATLLGHVEQIVYWTRIGTHVPTSWMGQRMAVAGDNLRGIVPDAVLARVSVIEPDRGQATALIDGFTRSLYEALSPLGRKVLLAA